MYMIQQQRYINQFTKIKNLSSSTGEFKHCVLHFDSTHIQEFTSFIQFFVHFYFLLNVPFFWSISRKIVLRKIWDNILTSGRTNMSKSIWIGIYKRKRGIVPVNFLCKFLSLFWRFLSFLGLSCIFITIVWMYVKKIEWGWLFMSDVG